MHNHEIDPHLKKMAHVTKDENFFIRNIKQIDKNSFTAQILINSGHEYLYEYTRNCNHVTSTAFIDSACQIIRTCLHEFCDTPKDDQLTLKSASMNFNSWAFTDQIMHVKVMYLAEINTSRGHLEKKFNIQFYQDRNIKMEMDVTCFCLNEKIQERLIEMAKQKQQA